MKTINQQLGRLLRAAARSPLAAQETSTLAAAELALPFGVEARVLAAWRLDQAVSDLFIPRLFKRATCLAALIMLVSVLWNIPALVRSVPPEQDISESLITLATLP